MKDLSRVVHHPSVSGGGFSSLAVPTYRASTIVFPNAEAYAKRKDRGSDGYTYGLHGTPTTRALQAQLSALERGERTVMAPSGQGAIAIVMLSVLMPGDKVLIPDTVYPPVRGLCADYLQPRGISYECYDPLLGEQIVDLIEPGVKLVWVESPGSTTMEVQDVPAIVRAAHSKGALVGCDNTWATPLLFKPLVHGADFSVEAITKYVGGHSDLLMGSISVRDLGLYERLTQTTRMTGIGVSPDDCSLALRGLETMGVRLAHVGSISTCFAGRLQVLPAVNRVLHPALPSCPGHEIWKRDFSGASGVFSVVLRQSADSILGKCLSNLKLFSIGASWGGTHSLIAPMSVTQDRVIDPERWNCKLLRMSIGLEDPDDLWSELTELFKGLAGVD
jgi:cystathionine beta-lyase